MRLFYNLRIDSLPKLGTLFFDNRPVKAGDVIQRRWIYKLNYKPSADTSGIDYFYWNVHNGVKYADKNEIFSIDIIAENDPPTFSVENITVNEDFEGTYFTTLSINHIPEDEKNQKVTYSITPTSIDFANFEFDPETGEASITSILNKNGFQQFTITANDGQLQNNLVSKNFSISINPINDEPIIDIVGDTALIIGESIILNLSISDVDLDNVTVFATSENEVIIDSHDITIIEIVKDENYQIQIQSSGRSTGICPIMLDVLDAEVTIRKFIFIDVVEPLNVIQNRTSEIIIYPNPTSSHLSILMDKKGDYIIEFLDLVGSTLLKVEKKNAQSNNINLDLIPPGTYILKISDNEDLIFTTSLLIKK